MWQEMIIAAIGEAFEEPDVAGISICIRKNEDLISVWNGDNRNDAIRFRIGEKIKQVLVVNFFISFCYIRLMIVIYRFVVNITTTTSTTVLIT